MRRRVTRPALVCIDPDWIASVTHTQTHTDRLVGGRRSSLVALMCMFIWWTNKLGLLFTSSCSFSFSSAEWGRRRRRRRNHFAKGSRKEEEMTLSEELLHFRSSLDSLLANNNTQKRARHRVTRHPRRQKCSKFFIFSSPLQPSKRGSYILQQTLAEAPVCLRLHHIIAVVYSAQ